MIDEPILNNYDGEHPVQGMRVYLRTRDEGGSRGTYNATRLVMCPLCGGQVAVEPGAHKLPWCDGKRWWVDDPDNLEYAELSK